MNNCLLNLLVKLEKSLHAESVRKSKDKLNDLLGDDFKEIGASGRVYNKDQIIQSLINETAFEIISSDYELKQLSKDIAQLKYKTIDNLNRITLRSSIWISEGKKWKLIFHQATMAK